jgi:hypothetical protein
LPRGLGGGSTLRRRARRRSAAPGRRRSRRTRKSLLLVFALAYAPAAARRAHAAGVELTALPAIASPATSNLSAAIGDVDAVTAAISDDRVAWHANDGAAGGWTLHTATTARNGAH